MFWLGSWDSGLLTATLARPGWCPLSAGVRPPNSGCPDPASQDYYPQCPGNAGRAPIGLIIAWSGVAELDAVTLAAVLLAVLTGASEALGGKLWSGMTSLVRRPLRRPPPPEGGAAVVPSGAAELAALEHARDEGAAVALARVLLARADADGEFGAALGGWWEQAGSVRASIGNVTNTISGGTQHGPALQGRDFTGLTFGTPAPGTPPAAPEAPESTP
jgi:hypothetical protein